MTDSQAVVVGCIWGLGIGIAVMCYVPIYRRFGVEPVDVRSALKYIGHHLLSLGSASRRRRKPP